MLLVVPGRVGVLRSSLPQRPLVRQPPQHTRLCVSTEVNVKTQTCLSECNSAARACPSACFCLDASNRSSSVSFALSSEELELLTDGLKRSPPGHWERDKEQRQQSGRQQHGRLSSSTPAGAQQCAEWCLEKAKMWPGAQARENFCRRPDCQSCKFCAVKTDDELPPALPPSAPPALPPAPPIWRSSLTEDSPARLPDNEELVGFYAKSWKCKLPGSSSCTGPAAKNLHVAQRGEIGVHPV